MRLKRILLALCIGILAVFQCLPVYAYDYYTNNNYYFLCDNGEEFYFRGYQRTPSKAVIPIYFVETEDAFWIVSDCGHSDWYVSAYGNGKTWQSYFTDPAEHISGDFYGHKILKGTAWGPFNSWGVEEVYNRGISRAEAGTTTKITYYTSLDDLGSEGLDFFRLTSVVYRVQMVRVPEILPGTMTTASRLLVCGVSLMASLIGLVLLFKVLKTFRARY